MLRAEFTTNPRVDVNNLSSVCSNGLDQPSDHNKTRNPSAPGYCKSAEVGSTMPAKSLQQRETSLNPTTTDSSLPAQLPAESVKEESPEIMHKGKRRIFIPVEDVFEQNTLMLANKEIDNLNTVDSSISGNDIVRVVIEGADQSLYNVYTFDKNAKLLDDSTLNLVFSNVSENIKNLAKQAIEKMAEKLKWKERKLDLSVNILRYTLSSSAPYIRNMPWHQDFGVSISMTTLITPYNSRSLKDEDIHGGQDNQEIGHTGFTGGELSIAPRKYPSPEEQWRAFYKEKEKPEQDQDKIFSFLINQDQIETFRYPYNGGFIFDNDQSYHRVNDISLIKPETVKDCQVERRLLTVFAPARDINYLLPNQESL